MLLYDIIHFSLQIFSAYLSKNFHIIRRNAINIQCFPLQNNLGCRHVTVPIHLSRYFHSIKATSLN